MDARLRGEGAAALGLGGGGSFVHRPPAECRGMCLLKLRIQLPEFWASSGSGRGWGEKQAEVRATPQVFNVGWRTARGVPGASWLLVSVCLALDWGSGACQPLSLSLL